MSERVAMLSGPRAAVLSVANLTMTGIRKAAEQRL